MIPDTNRPVPAAIDGRRWTVAASPGDLAGATDTRKANLFAPLTDTPTGRLVRNHELAHARITPRTGADAACRKHGVTMEAVQWSEDARVSKFLDRAELVDADALTPAEADSIAATIGDNERSMAGAMLTHWFLDSQREKLVDAFGRRGVSRSILDGIRAAVCSIVGTALMAARPKRRGRRPSGGWAKKAFATPAGFRTFTVTAAKRFDFEFPPEGPEGGRGDKSGDGAAAKARTVLATGSWAPVDEIRRLPLDRSIRPRRAPGRRFSDAGVIPSAVHRLPVDGSIFSTRRKVKGGTVLCDASGSMSYSDADIERLILEAPGATIAFYSGRSHGKNGPFGRIVIAADRGRAAALEAVREALPGEDNLIDGPALRWLARQPGPRFWISDEGVGGMTDFGIGCQSHSECLAICRAAGIKIVPRIDALRR
jgi:hypothetical protein